MNNEIKFRNQLNGFNKNDVIAYIKELDTAHETNTTLLYTEIRKKSSELEEESAKLIASIAETEQYKSETELLTSKLNEKAILLEQKNEAIATLENDSNMLKAVIDELKLSLQESEQKTAELQNALDNARELHKQYEKTLAEPVLPQNAIYLGDINDKNSVAYKLSMYDKISSELGDIMINTSRNADDMVSKASKQAEDILRIANEECSAMRLECEAEVRKIKADTAEEADYIRKRLSGAASELLSEISTELHKNIENCITEIETGIMDMRYDIDALVDRMVTKKNDMGDKVGYYQSCVAESITKKLADMDIKYGIAKGSEDKHD